MTRRSRSIETLLIPVRATRVLLAADLADIYGSHERVRGPCLCPDARAVRCAATLKRLAEIDKSLLEHDQSLRVIWHKLQPLLAPAPAPPRSRIGFNRNDA